MLTMSAHFDNNDNERDFWPLGAAHARAARVRCALCGHVASAHTGARCHAGGDANDITQPCYCPGFVAPLAGWQRALASACTFAGCAAILTSAGVVVIVLTKLVLAWLG